MTTILENHSGIHTPKSIKFADLQRMALCNSEDMPTRIWHDGRLRLWVGIGWIDVAAHLADGTEPVVVD